MSIIMSHVAPGEPSRNFRAKCWEVRAACGRLLWSRNRRWLTSWNVPRHINSCWKCSFIERFRFYRRKPDLHNTARLRVSFTSVDNLAVGVLEYAKDSTGERGAA